MNLNPEDARKALEIIAPILDVAEPMVAALRTVASLHEEWGVRGDHGDVQWYMSEKYARNAASVYPGSVVICRLASWTEVK